MHDATRLLRAILGPETQGASFLTGPVFAAQYHAAGDPLAIPYSYGRTHNPTWTALEQALGILEEAEVVVFPSGIAACFSVLGTVLQSGDLVVLPADGYYTVRLLLKEQLARFGIRVREVPTDTDALLEALPGATLLWLESPSNPGLDCCDIARLADAAHAAGTLVAVDNTTATALGQQPLDLGADFSVTSDTKAMTGHGDLLLGHVAVRDEARATALQQWRTYTGSIPGPMEAWLALRSLATLEVRLVRQCASALQVARFLQQHGGVSAVRYPGLPDDPSYALAARQMRHFGPVIGFTLPSAESAERFLAAGHLISEATSFGSVHTTAERRARWGGDAVAPGFIRLSIGCEQVDDLLADLSQALIVALA